jgi:mono/diheme cytochrome c family protein
MPYPGFAQMCARDRDAVVTWVRGLHPIEHEVPQTELDFPVNLIVRTLPAHAEAPSCPDRTDEVAHGKYLATLASCTDCHTPREKGAPVPGKDFAGGAEFGLPTGGTVRSANITPDPTTGIGAWDKATFVARFKAFAGKEQHKVARGDFQTVMPWTLFAGMSEEDLGAIYAYLRTLPPVKNEVNRFSPPSR